MPIKIYTDCKQDRFSVPMSCVASQQTIHWTSRPCWQKQQTRAWSCWTDELRIAALRVGAASRRNSRRRQQINALFVTTITTNCLFENILASLSPNSSRKQLVQIRRSRMRQAAPLLLHATFSNPPLLALPLEVRLKPLPLESTPPPPAAPHLSSLLSKS
jgi:hypothetical protein